MLTITPIWRVLPGSRLDEGDAPYRRLSEAALGCAASDQVFVEGLLVGKSRLLAMGAEQRQGAFTDVKDADFNGKIVYRPCRKGVYPPTQWDAQLAARSGDTPEHGLELEFVYGYEGCVEHAHTTGQRWKCSSARSCGAHGTSEAYCLGHPYLRT